MLRTWNGFGYGFEFGDLFYFEFGNGFDFEFEDGFEFGDWFDLQFGNGFNNEWKGNSENGFILIWGFILLGIWKWIIFDFLNLVIF